MRRVIKEGEYVAKTGATVRAAAKEFLYSKSTVHKDLTERLKGVDGELFLRVKAVLKRNMEERHVRGGQATREKYLRARVSLDKTPRP